MRGEIIMRQAPEWVRTSDSVIIVQHINLGTELLIVYSVCMGKKSIESHNAWYTHMRVVYTNGHGNNDPKPYNTNGSLLQEYNIIYGYSQCS